MLILLVGIVIQLDLLTPPRGVLGGFSSKNEMGNTSIAIYGQSAFFIVFRWMILNSRFIIWCHLRGGKGQALNSSFMPRSWKCYGRLPWNCHQNLIDSLSFGCCTMYSCTLHACFTVVHCMQYSCETNFFGLRRFLVCNLPYFQQSNEKMYMKYVYVYQ